MRTNSFIITLLIIIFLPFYTPCFQKKREDSLKSQDDKKVQKYIIDYNGDGKSDVSVFSCEDHTLYIKNQSDYRWKDYRWETIFEIPLPILCDFNGDTQTDIAFYDKGFWHIYGILLTKIGTKGDIPVPGDYDGDGKIDIAVWRPSSGAWLFWIERDIVFWGEAQDIPLPLDYDGDGKADIAVWRPSDGNWYIKRSLKEPLIIQWGTEGDIPVPGDYDGDGKADIAVWRPSDGSWHIKRSLKEPLIIQWGTEGDIPVPGDYDGDGATEIAVWKPNEGLWSIKNKKSIKFGRPHDIPLTWNVWISWKKKILKKIINNK